MRFLHYVSITSLLRNLHFPCNALVAVVLQQPSGSPARLCGSLAHLALVAAVDGLVPSSTAQGRIPANYDYCCYSYDYCCDYHFKGPQVQRYYHYYHDDDD